MSLKILYKVTSRSRPEWCKRAIQSILDNEVDPVRLILVSADYDDSTMTSPEFLEWCSQNPVHLCYGKSKNKIDAINRDVNKITEFYDWDVLVNVSDDQVFIVNGFDDIIRNGIFDNTKTQENIDCVLHFPDGNRSDLMTMSIIGRQYYERDKYIYWNEYITECCDDEAQEVAKMRGCYKYIDVQIFDHLHVAYGKAPMDKSYEENLVHEKRMKDRETLERRRANNFQ